MRILIKFDSCWGNSFLSDPDAKGKRSYIASLSKMNNGKNKDNALEYYKERLISLSTVQGVLYRLLGARDRLSVLLEHDESVLADLIRHKSISFELIDVIETDESVYLRNANLSGDQNSYSGVPNEDLLDNGEFIHVLGILYAHRDELLNYIVNDVYPINITQKLSILEIAELIEGFHKEKGSPNSVTKVEFESVNNKIKEMFGKDIHPTKANLMLLALNKAVAEFAGTLNEKSEFLTATNTFAGISLNGNSFTRKDFMKKFASTKLVYGNPYQTDYWIKNEYSVKGTNKKFNKKLTKRSGVLAIDIDCCLEVEEELRTLIINAGVSAFYLGKKGLAYVDKII